MCDRRMNEFEIGVVERLVRMETKLDSVKDQFQGHDSRIKHLEDNTPDPDHESRIRKLERVIWIAIGASGALGGGAGALFTQLAGG